MAKVVTFQPSLMNPSPSQLSIADENNRMFKGIEKRGWAEEYRKLYPNDFPKQKKKRSA